MKVLSRSSPFRAGESQFAVEALPASAEVPIISLVAFSYSSFVFQRPTNSLSGVNITFNGRVNPKASETKERNLAQD
jgi:hypothetical protein